MTNKYAHLLIAPLIAASSVCAAAETPSGGPAQATVNVEIINPTLREFTIDYMSPQALEKTVQQVVLDGDNRFTLTLPVTRGTLIVGHYHNGEPRPWWKEWLEPLLDDTRHLVLFVEPGDSLDAVMEVGWLSPSFRFRGRNADNNRFIAARISGFLPLRLNYETLEMEDFSRGMDTWRQEQLERLARGKEEYALSAGFVDYAEAFVQYGWAERMITYPAVYRRVNRRENREITPEYYGFLEEVPLADERAIGVQNYRPFLVQALDRELGEAPPPSRLSDQYDFSRSGLSEAAAARLDSLYETAFRRRSPGSSTWGNSVCPRPTERGSTPFSTGTTGRTSRRFPWRPLPRGSIPRGKRWSSSCPETNGWRRSRGGADCPRRSTCRVWACRRRPGPGSTRYTPIPTRNGGGGCRNDTTWPQRGWRGECSTGFKPGS